MIEWDPAYMEDIEAILSSLPSFLFLFSVICFVCNFLRCHLGRVSLAKEVPNLEQAQVFLVFLIVLK